MSVQWRGARLRNGSSHCSISSPSGTPWLKNANIESFEAGFHIRPLDERPAVRRLIPARQIERGQHTRNITGLIRASTHIEASKVSERGTPSFIDRSICLRLMDVPAPFTFGHSSLWTGRLRYGYSNSSLRQPFERGAPYWIAIVPPGRCHLQHTELRGGVPDHEGDGVSKRQSASCCLERAISRA
jgi:hypothetical protein